MSLNQDIIDELERMKEYYAETGDGTREKAYERAIDSVSNYPSPIRTGKEATKLKWIGKKIGWRIDQVLGTHTVEVDGDDGDGGGNNTVPKHSSKKMKEIESPQARIRASFIDVPERSTQSTSTRPRALPNQKYREAHIRRVLENEMGEPDDSERKSATTGVSVAAPRLRATFVDDGGPEEELYNLSRPSPRQRRSEAAAPLAAPHVRASAQRQGVAATVSRVIAEKFLHLIRHMAARVASEARVALVDTYRRGHQRIPALVFLLTCENRTQTVVDAVAQQLLNIKTGLINTVRLGLQSGQQQPPHWKGSVAFRTDPPAAVPLYLIGIHPECWPCALLRYTGPNQVWREMQQFASDRHLRLTERGLFDQHSNQRIPLRSERDVFTRINVEYVPPEMRNL